MNQQNSVIDHDWCLNYISDTVFRFQPESYCKDHPIWPGMIGLELEMHPFSQKSLEMETPQPVKLSEGESSLHRALEELGSSYPDWTFKRSDGATGLLMGIALENNDQVSFEPGGQLEISTIPFPCLEDAQNRLSEILSVVKNKLSDYDISLLHLGSNPWFDADQIGLQMKKPRYRAMDSFFNKIGPYGRCMMRQTATLQVNLDFGSSEEDMAKRYLLANLLAPLGTAIFANSGISNGKANGYKSLRAIAWQNLDPTRTGFPKLEAVRDQLNKQSCVDAYAQRILDSRVVFVEGLDYQVQEQHISLSNWINHPIGGRSPTAQDFETHLSLFFPEVRARGFLELRSIDSQSECWLPMPAYFYTGLLYDPQSLEKALDLMLPYLPKLHHLWERCAYGLEDSVLRELAVKVVHLAREGFARLPSCYHGGKSKTVMDRFIETFTDRGRSPVDDLLDAMKTNEDGILKARDIRRVEQKWQELATD